MGDANGPAAAERVPHRTAKTSALVLELYGGFLRRLGGRIAIAHLIQLLADLGVEASVVRAAVARLTRSGLLRRSAGYELTEQGAAVLAEGDRRLFERRPPTDARDGWVLVVFSIPERQRHVRHVLRVRLSRLGFGKIAPGVWLAPRWLLDDARGVVQRLGLISFVQIYVAEYRGDDDMRALVGRAWDLETLAGLYAAFVREHSGLLGDLSDDASIDPRAAFVEYMRVQSDWRRLPLLDPGLPPEFLPADWEGAAAADLFFALRAILDPPALEHVRAVTRS
jgi:phenylacetic acid degradation operon negative regulatory protein